MQRPNAPASLRSRGETLKHQPKTKPWKESRHLALGFRRGRGGSSCAGAWRRDGPAEREGFPIETIRVNLET
jgi:hypothetical protein